MERHSVPQNIMDVEFKLFGAFTIKQFAYLAAGIVVSLLIFFTPIPGILKMILIAFSSLMGMFLGLVRINGQASTVFVANFIAALFSTQTRLWNKEAKTPKILEESKAVVNPRDAEKLMEAQRSVSRAAKLLPLEQLVEEGEDNELDIIEDTRLSEIEKHFDFAVEDLKKQTKRVDEVKRPATPPKPQPKVDVKTEPPAMVQFDPDADNLAGSIANKELEGEPIIRTNKYANMFKQMQSRQNRPIAGQGQTNEPPQQQEPVTTQDSVEQPADQTQQTVQKQEPQINQAEQEMQQQNEAVQQEINSEVQEEKQPEPKREEVQETVQQEEQKVVQEEQPKQPVIPAGRKPNIIAGVVVDKSDKPIAHAVIEIKDQKEHLIRKQTATANGTFSLNTPLENGTYHIDVVADGFKFARFELILSGTALPNYKFRAK